MAFAQLTYERVSATSKRAYSLSAVSSTNGVQKQGGTIHSGRRKPITRLAIYADFAQVLIAIARPLYASDPIDVDLDQSLYALDSTTIDLCLSLFPWAKFREHKAAVKMHTLLDLHGNIPTFIRITDGKVHDVNILDGSFPKRCVLCDGPWLHRF